MRFNNSPFMTKDLRKATTHRSRMKNIYTRKNIDKIGKNIRSKEIFVLTLFVKPNQNTLKIVNDLPDNRKFWKTNLTSVIKV